MKYIDLKHQLKKTFISLKYPNYRFWFIGQIISMMGTWVQMTAQGFLMYELTHSMAYLGYMSLASGLPSILLMLYGGVFADRFSRRYLLMITQSIMMVLAFILFFLVFFNLVLPWHILLLSFVFGIANSFDVPSRQAIVFELVEKEDLSNAIALNSMMFNGAAIIGPAIAGIIFVTWGPSWCFFINGLSFIGILVVLFVLKLNQTSKSKKDTKTMKGQLIDGIKYSFSGGMIKLLIIVTVFTSVIGMAFSTLLPAWAKDILHGDASTYGHLNSFRGLGALIGALLVASISNLEKRYQLLKIGTFMVPSFVLAFSLNKNTNLALICMMGVGGGLLIIFNTLNSLIQNLVSDELRGRVLSVYSVSFFGGMPLGAFFTGIIAEAIGAPTTLILSSLICFGVAIWFHMKLKERSDNSAPSLL